MRGEIDEPEVRTLKYFNLQAHNTKVPGDVAHRTHSVRTTQPPLLNRSSTLHILLPYNGSDIASYIAFDSRGMKNGSKGLGENWQRMCFKFSTYRQRLKNVRMRDGLSTSCTYRGEKLEVCGDTICGLFIDIAKKNW